MTAIEHLDEAARAMDVEAVARSLTKTQREALLGCNPWDVEVGIGPAIAFICNGLLQNSTLLNDGIELTPLGLAVRAHLKGEGK